MLDEIERLALNGSPTAQSIEKEFRAFVNAITLQNFAAIAQAYEVYCEGVACVLLDKQGIKFKRTPGTGGHKQQRPDLECELDGIRFFVEVKALEVQGGKYHHQGIMNEALEIQADLDERAKEPGVHVGGALELSGFKVGATRADRIESLIEKIENNAKFDQLTYGPTVLMVMLGRLPSDADGPYALVPAYMDETSYSPNVLSGELWHVGFGQPGNLILDWVEFEGAKAIDRLLSKEGVLHSRPYLVGVAFVSQDIRDEHKVLGLCRSVPDFTPIDVSMRIPDDHAQYIMTGVCDAVNDELNSEGYRFIRRMPKERTNALIPLADESKSKVSAIYRLLHSFWTWVAATVRGWLSKH
ncbi:hypothetical protein [Microvirga calopogonii]|uniref:hypothetical protein n=1 Tax=Microvirga calopogonii TaxID=2078013 RepID=UPI000E0D4D1F|nr:hypothetical protein [Microvirga calopogonii]